MKRHDAGVKNTNIHNRALGIVSYIYCQLTENGTTTAEVNATGSVKLNHEIEEVSANQGLALKVKFENGKIHAEVKGY